MGPGSTGRPQDGAGSRGRRAARLRRNQPEPRRTPPRTWPDGRRTLVDGGTWVLDFGGLQPELDRPPSGPAQPHRWCRTQPGSWTQQDARRTLVGLRGNSPELAGRCRRTFPDSGRTRAGTGAGLCRTSKDAPYCRGSYKAKTQKCTAKTKRVFPAFFYARALRAPALCTCGVAHTQCR